jgi:uncharacterized protein
MIILDTTVLVYAKGTDHPLRAQRRTRSDAASLGSDYADLLSPLLAADDKQLRRGLVLFERHERLGAFDAVLAAAAMDADASAFVSADGAFADVPGLSHIIPDDREVKKLLERD